MHVLSLWHRLTLDAAKNTMRNYVEIGEMIHTRTVEHPLNGKFFVSHFSVAVLGRNDLYSISFLRISSGENKETRIS